VTPLINPRRLVGFGIVVLLSLPALDAAAQTDSGDRPNLIGFELLGRGGLYSLNYERSVTPRVGFGMGFATLGPSGFFKRIESNRVTVPMYVSWHPLGEAHALYLASGITLLMSKKAESPSGAQSTGYDIQPIGTVTFGRKFRFRRGVLFRPSMTRAFVRGSPDGFLTGFTIGFAF
jgi:hypothetical protein